MLTKHTNCTLRPQQHSPRDLTVKLEYSETASTESQLAAPGAAKELKPGKALLAAAQVHLTCMHNGPAAAHQHWRS